MTAAYPLSERRFPYRKNLPSELLIFDRVHTYGQLSLCVNGFKPGTVGKDQNIRSLIKLVIGK